MIEVTIPNGPVFTFQDDPAELPARRLNRFDLNLLQAGGMGTTVADLMGRLDSVFRYLKAGLTEEAAREVQNLTFGFSAGIEQGLSTDCRCLAELILSVDGVAWADYSDAGLNKVAALIAEHIPLREVRQIADTVKKNLIPN